MTVNLLPTLRKKSVTSSAALLSVEAEWPWRWESGSFVVAAKLQLVSGYCCRQWDAEPVDGLEAATKSEAFAARRGRSCCRYPSEVVFLAEICELQPGEQLSSKSKDKGMLSGICFAARCSFPVALSHLIPALLCDAMQPGRVAMSRRSLGRKRSIYHPLRNLLLVKHRSLGEHDNGGVVAKSSHAIFSR